MKYKKTLEKGASLNRLMGLWPRGLVVPTGWLRAQGFSSQMLAYYLKVGYLERVEGGAVTYPKDKPSHWVHILYSLQNYSGLQVHAGGRTVLDAQGYGPNLDADPKRRKVYVYGTAPALPSWAYLPEFNLEYRRVNLDQGRLKDRQAIVPAETPQGANLGLEGTTVEHLDVNVSGLERAFLELLFDVPGQVSLEDALDYAKGLQGLRPSLMQQLLEWCKVDKVNRLALYFGAAFQLPWFGKLDLNRVGLGVSKRQLAKGGVLDPRFRITVPKGWPLSPMQEAP